MYSKNTFTCISLAGSHSGHLTKTVVTGVSTHEGPTYYHHHYGSSYDGCAARDVEVIDRLMSFEAAQAT